MTTSAATTSAGTDADPRRWKALGVLALVQFMLILDVTVVNVALPYIKDDLGFSRSGLAWVVDGYTIMAGGLLLLGGRLSDLVGRRRLFLIGVALFAVASLTCGAAQDPAMLVISRFVQGTGEALAAPAALGIVAVLFPDPAERTKALGIWGGLAGLGGTLGTVISGVLTNYASWRWIFYVNLPVAVIAFVMVPRLVSESRAERSEDRHRPDVLGAITITGGLIAVVYGLLRADQVSSWFDASVLAPLVVGVALIAAFVVVERTAKDPLIPARFFTNRTRVAANASTLFFSSAFFTFFFLLTQYLQTVLGWHPLKGGLAYLPFGFGIGAAIGIGTALLPKVGIKVIMVIGFVLSAAGLVAISGIEPHAQYASHVLPGMLLLAFGAGISFAAIGNAALHGVTGQDASLASGVQNAVQQLGGSLGLAVLVSIAYRHVNSAVAGHTPYPVAATDAFTLAFRVGAGILVAGGIVAAIFLENYKATPEPLEEAFANAEALPEPA